MNQKYKHLFFDLDHTLWDFEQNSEIALQKVCHEFKIETSISFEDFLQQYKIENDLLWKRYKDGFIKSEDLKWKRMWRTLLHFKIADENLSKAMAAFYLDLLPLQTKLFENTIQLLDYLKAKHYHLHIISNGFEEVQHNKLKHSSILNYFKTIVCSETVHAVKPNKEIFEIALKLADANLGDSLMLGDNPEADILGANNIGMDVVFVNHKNEKINQPYNYEITNLIQLKSFL